MNKAGGSKLHTLHEVKHVCEGSTTNKIRRQKGYKHRIQQHKRIGELFEHIPLPRRTHEGAEACVFVISRPRIDLQFLELFYRS